MIKFDLSLRESEDFLEIGNKVEILGDFYWHKGCSIYS